MDMNADESRKLNIFKRGIRRKEHHHLIIHIAAFFLTPPLGKILSVLYPSSGQDSMLPGPNNVIYQ